LYDEIWAMAQLLEDTKIPNWCANSLTVSHSDPAMLDRFMAAVAADNLFGEFVPLQESGEWDYELAIKKWGTKWEASDPNFDRDGNTVSGSFSSAWAPPIEFYQALVELGFEVDANYHEPGMSFAGVFTNEGETFYDYDFSDPNWRDEIDHEGILETLDYEYESYLEYNEDGNQD
jgi:hypothetical protein